MALGKRVVGCWLLLLIVAPWAGFALPTPTPEEALRDRVRDFTNALIREQYEEAVKYVDPEIVTAFGKEEVKDAGRHLMNRILTIVEAGHRKITGFKIRSVELIPDTDKAIVNLYYKTALKRSGQLRQAFPGDQHWVLQDGTWYWTLEALKKLAPKQK